MTNVRNKADITSPTSNNTIDSKKVKIKLLRRRIADGMIQKFKIRNSASGQRSSLN